MTRKAPHKAGRNATSRRTFLKVGSAAALTVLSAPYITGCTDKTGKRKPVIGDGEHKYEVTHGWGQLPEHIRWGDTHGVCVDASGLIYMKHRNTSKVVMDAIVVFDRDGKYVRSFGKEFHGGGHGIDVRKEGGEEFLYLSDITNNVVAKMNLQGELVWKFGLPEEPGVYRKGMRFRPTNIAFAPDGGFYVADGYGSHFIHQYDRNAKWVRTWGGKGSEPGKMQTPHGLWLDDRPGRKPAIVVADRANARLQYFTLDGKHIEFVEDFLFPADIDTRGEVMLVPDLHARITLLDRNNHVLTHLGDDASWRQEVLDEFKVRRQPERWKPGKFVHPHDACFDKDGNIFVTEWVPTGRVSLLNRVG